MTVALRILSRLLAALAEGPDAYLWLVGTGSLAGVLTSQAASLGLEERVRFLGWREDTAALYAAADLYVCPSRIEPLGNVVIEAWAHNTPVVAAAAAGPAALIENPVHEDGRAASMPCLINLFGTVERVARAMDARHGPVSYTQLALATDREV